MDQRSTVAELAERYGTDKTQKAHIYENAFAEFRDRPVTLLEIGVGGYSDPAAGGASVRMWADYFPNGQVYALDIEDKSRHEGERIRIFRGSQFDADMLRSVVAETGPLDIIIDDGSHVSEHVIFSLEHLYPHLKPGGLYVVEDTGTSYWPDWGGSLDPNDPATSMSYLKRIADGLNVTCMRAPYQTTYVDQNTESVTFFYNAVVLRKKR